MNPLKSEADEEANGLIGEPDFNIGTEPNYIHSRDKLNAFIADYKFSGKEPLRETVLNACNEKPKLYRAQKDLRSSRIAITRHHQQV
jgi:hypothetical protein